MQARCPQNLRKTLLRVLRVPPLDVCREMRALMTPDEMGRLRIAWRRYWQAYDRWHAKRDARQEAARLAWLGNRWGRYVEPICEPFPRIPAAFQKLVCGARTRFGTLCKRRDLYRSGRCKLHGGLSTGPRTLEGKTRSASNAGRPIAERTPCEGQDYGKVTAQCEPDVRFIKVDLARAGNGCGAAQSWSATDGF